MSLVTSLFFPVLLLNQLWSPPLRLQASHCSTFRIMCDVPSIAVLYSESIEYFPGMASEFLFKTFVTIPLDPVFTGIIVHFIYHIRCIFVPKLFVFKFLFCFIQCHISVRSIATSINRHRYDCSMSTSFSSKLHEICPCIFSLAIFFCSLCYAVLYFSCSSL